MRIGFVEDSMPNSTEDQTLRREAIRQLLLKGPAETQQVLVAELRAGGFVATQSSVSRDLKDLGAIKSNEGYELPGTGADQGGDLHGVSDLLRTVSPAGPNLIVIKTAIGAAQRVALALDRSNWSEMVGNISGDDTVFVATDSLSNQKILISRIAHAGPHT
jgi:transcriptional regulator of arginine metabolism